MDEDKLVDRIGCLLIALLVGLILTGIFGSIFLSKVDSQTFFCGDSGSGVVWEEESFLFTHSRAFRPMTADEYQLHCNRAAYGKG